MAKRDAVEAPQAQPWRPAYQISNRPYWYGYITPRMDYFGWARGWLVRVLVGRPWLHHCPRWEITTIETQIPRPNGKFAGFGGPLPKHPARPWIEEDLAKLSAGEAWWAQIGSAFFLDDPYENDPACDKKNLRKRSFIGPAPLHCSARISAKTNHSAPLQDCGIGRSIIGTGSRCGFRGPSSPSIANVAA
jgi:hypothetical protein